jgi:AcrR family transcriptional regulator
MAKMTRKEAARTRENILAAALAVCARDGMQAKLDEIAHEAGVTRGAIYGHFVNRESLLRTALQAQPLPLEQLQIENRGFEEVWDQIRRNILETVGGDERRQLATILMHKAERGAAPAQDRLQLAIARVDRHLHRMLTLAVETGELSAGLNIDRTSALLRACISGLIFESLQETEPHSQEIAQTLDVLLHLLRRPPELLLMATRTPAGAATGIVPAASAGCAEEEGRYRIC